MSDDAKHEIFIVRHRHSDHDDHHGGAWKIAFADFMTAMMAFFLVMWLISANDKTRASVARYFNPVRLVDATTQPRGLHDSKKDESGITASPGSKEDAKDGEAKEKKPSADKAGGKEAAGKEAASGKETPAGKDKRLDAALRENPYAALAEIVATKGPGDAPPAAAGRDKATAAIGRRGGDAFRDPFAPPRPAPAAASTDLAGDPERSETKVTDARSITDTAARRDPATGDKATGDKAAADQASPEKPATDKLQAEKLQADRLLAEKVAAVAGAGARDAAGPRVDVRRTAEGLLVSLTDTADFAMFPSGSAVPDKRVVLLMEKVAKVLRERPGTAILRGYTDSRPYKGGRYDNWHLSLDRAQVTHYMLVRGGFAEARIGHVEGYADHAGRAGLDPASPLNRRIEILLKDAAP